MGLIKGHRKRRKRGMTQVAGGGLDKTGNDRKEAVRSTVQYVKSERQDCCEIRSTWFTTSHLNMKYEHHVI